MATKFRARCESPDDHRWAALDGGEPYCKVCGAKQGQVEAEARRIVLQCGHLERGERSLAHEVLLAEGNLAQLCDRCWAVIVGDVLKEVMAAGVKQWAQEGAMKLHGMADDQRAE